MNRLFWKWAKSIFCYYEIFERLHFNKFKNIGKH